MSAEQKPHISPFDWVRAYLRQSLPPGTVDFTGVHEALDEAEAENKRLVEQLEALRNDLEAERVRFEVYESRAWEWREAMHLYRDEYRALRELLANGAEIATHYMDTDGRGDLDGWIAAVQDALRFPTSPERDTSAADVDGAGYSAGHHESVGERQGRQPAPDSYPASEPEDLAFSREYGMDTGGPLA